MQPLRREDVVRGQFAGTVSLGMQINQAGEDLRSRSVELAYRYSEEHEGEREAAYARLFNEAMEGQQRLFARADGVEGAWRVVDPVLADRGPAHSYEPGSWGPEQADELIAGDGGWHDPQAATMSDAVPATHRGDTQMRATAGTRR